MKSESVGGSARWGAFCDNDGLNDVAPRESDFHPFSALLGRLAIG